MSKPEEEKYRQKIRGNIAAIFKEIDELETMTAEFKLHLFMNDSYFFRHDIELQKDPRYGTIEDLVELFLDTCQLLSRLEKTKLHLGNACHTAHFYDYKSNEFFENVTKHLEKNR